jgi:hypothetical protein
MTILNPVNKLNQYTKLKSLKISDTLVPMQAMDFFLTLAWWELSCNKSATNIFS